MQGRVFTANEYGAKLNYTLALDAKQVLRQSDRISVRVTLADIFQIKLDQV
jgi:hypothetical protein